MSNEKYNFKFFNPVAGIAQAGVVQNNFPAFVKNADLVNLKKNIPVFEELAVGIGLNAVKGAILKNTFKFFTAGSNAAAQKEGLKFPANALPSKDAPLKSIGSSIFGTPVFSNLFIKGGSYQDNSGNVIGTYPDIRIDAVIMEINNETNIITVDIQGRDGTVIEYIGSKSYNINCRGRILSNARNTYPYNDVKDLMTALNSNKSLQVNAWFLNMAGIYNMVIKKKSFPQEEGSMEWQKFEFEAMADTPVILKLKP